MVGALKGSAANTSADAYDMPVMIKTSACQSRSASAASLGRACSAARPQDLGSSLQLNELAAQAD